MVDDNPANIDFLIEILKDYDDLTVAMSAAEAEEAIRINRPSLILLDIEMPEKNGLQFCKELKADPKTADIPVIFLTAANDEKTISKAIDIGGLDYIVKPYVPKLVSMKIKNALELHKTQRQDGFCVKDHVTGLPNSSVLEMDINRLYRHANSEGKPLTVVAFGVLNLNAVNTAQGMVAGDMMLRAIGSYFEKMMAGKGKGVKFYRRHGGIFIAVLYGYASLQLEKWAESVSGVLSNLQLQAGQDKETKETVSPRIVYGMADSIENKNGSQTALHLVERAIGRVG